VRKLAGTLAAAFTPLRDGGEALDLDAIGPYTDYLAAGGIDGVFALGSTGEGILLDDAERHQVVEAFRAATAGRLDLAVHAGSMSTRQTVALAAHAAEAGADAVAVIAPPYYPFTADGLLEHFAAAAAACAPLAFYAYEFEARSGYAIPPTVVERLRERAPNFAGMKVSDKPFSAVAPYLLEGLDLFVGFEPMIPEALGAGAVGSVSGLAAVFPDEVAAVVREPSPQGARRLVELRALVDPILPKGKSALAQRGLMRADVRAPMTSCA
jgi:dihydrodipicolinate synthase/N-acetylneuraminate lyase